MPASSKQAIYEQIEQGADYYAPRVYSILNGFGNYSFEQESNEEFIPLTQTRTRDPILFAVGLLPPSSNVTGRLLDRSASVRDLTQAAIGGALPGTAGTGVTATKNGKRYIVSAEGYQVKPGSGSSTGATPPPMSTPTFPTPSKTACSTAQVWALVYNSYVKIKGTAPTATEMQFYVMVAMRETGGAALNGNFGGVGNYPAANVKKADDGTYYVERPDGSRTTVYVANNGNGFVSYPDLQSGADAYMRAIVSNDNAVAAAKDGDVMGYMTSLAQRNYFTESIQTYYETGAGGGQSGWARQMAQVSNAMAGYGVTLDNGSGLPSTVPDACAFHEDTFQYHARLGGAKKLTPDDNYRFKEGSKYDDNCALSAAAVGATSEGDNTKNWVNDGSPNAKTAKTEEDKLSSTDLNRTELGKKFQAAQEKTVRAMLAELEKMRNTPPLKLIVNPTSFKVSSEKIISDGEWTRNGPIVEHWGDAQDTIEASGKVTGFYTIDSRNAVGPGLNRTARHYSAAYQNLMSLWMIYRNNGGLFLDLAKITGTKGEITRLSVVGSVYLYYDGILYFGSFENFNITESDSGPFTLEYNFQFKVRSAFFLDRPLNPKGFTYGNTPAIPGPTSVPTRATKLQSEDEKALSKVDLPPDQVVAPIVLPANPPIDDVPPAVLAAAK